jgi:hypothetical protein
MFSNVTQSDFIALLTTSNIASAKAIMLADLTMIKP